MIYKLLIIWIEGGSWFCMPDSSCPSKKPPLPLVVWLSHTSSQSLPTRVGMWYKPGQSGYLFLYTHTGFSKGWTCDPWKANQSLSMIFSRLILCLPLGSKPIRTTEASPCCLLFFPPHKKIPLDMEIILIKANLGYGEIQDPKDIIWVHKSSYSKSQCTSQSLNKQISFF